MKTGSPSGYGTIPTAAPPPRSGATPESSSAASRANDLIAGLKEQGQSLIAARRPWQELLNPGAFACPFTTSEATARIRRNLSYFRANYTIVVLLAVFLSLIWHPSSLFAFVALCAAWLFLYFSRNGPLVLFGHSIDDGVILAALSVVTVVSLIVTDVASNVLMSIMVGLAIIGIHAAMRTTDDLFLDEQAAASGGLLSVTGTPVRPTYVRVV